MENRIHYRAYEKKDAQAVANIIRKTWHYDELCRKQTAEKLAYAYLYSCLCNQSFTRVAVVNQQVVGIIMAKDNSLHHTPFALRVQQIIAIIRLLLDRQGRKVCSIFQRVETIDKELRKSCGIRYQGEVAFFALDPAMRGKGVGKVLFHKMQEYLCSRGIEHFFLYTDTTCNFGFYEHQGLQRKREKAATFQLGDTEVQMQFFLYDGTVKKMETSSHSS